MSLNGLDNPAVLEAYQCTLIEAGGWFLLQYVSRDEVSLLNRGSGGVPDVRNAIDAYEETSPLYGFLQYRRRKVILSYLPEGVSRLVKARTTVQFQSVLDKFSPHDTVFSLSKSSDLTESALSSACLLHAASGSITSSSSSLRRRRRLMEITEDAEENATDRDVPNAQSPASDAPHRPFSQRSDATLVAAPRAPSRLQQTTTTNDRPPSPAETTNSNAPDVPSMTTTTTTNDQQPPSITFDHHPERNLRDDISQAPSESRRFSQSSRASFRDPDHATTYTPKAKRGPRPSVDSNGRPRTAGILSRSQEQRPVASLPAGIRSSALRRPSPTNPSRPRSQGNPVASSISGRGVPPVPPLLVPSLSMPISRPQISPGAKSLSAMSTTGVSPEKERLMKALQQRKKQMEKRTGQNIHNQPVPEIPAQDASKSSENAGSAQFNHDKEAVNRAATVNNASEQSTQPIPTATEPRKEAEANGQTKPDSAVELMVSDSDGDQPSNTTSPPSTTPSTTTTATTSIDQSNNNEDDGDGDGDDDHARKGPEEAQAPQTVPVPEPETDASAVSVNTIDGESKDGPRSPSVVVDGPLENKSRKGPENEIIVSPPPTKQPPNLGGREVDTIAEAPEPISQPDAPSSADSSSSTTIVSNGREPQHESPVPEHSDAVRLHVTQRKEKRRPILEPIQVPTPEYSDDDNLLSDDSFMEELKSATVQEAKPVSVGKSPLSPAYPNNGNDQLSSPEAWKNSRAVSNPSASIESQSPNLHMVTEGRSVSSTYPDANSAMSPVLVARKVNLSSGISKRIKALEKFTGPTSTPSNAAESATPPSVDTSRKRTSISKDSPSISRSPSVDPSPRSEGISRDDSQSSINVTQPTNSVSVTARIVRDSHGSPDASDRSVLRLQASPLTVEHETSEVPLGQNLTAESAIDEREKRSMSTSSASSGNQPLSATLPCSESRLSISSQSRGDAAKSGSDSDEKRASRTSRILHRMSSITSNSRRSFLGALSPSPSFKEEDALSVSEKEPEPTPETHQAVDVGEVNVQFPDTLLWKRRFVRVDDKGYLVLAPANVDSSGRNMTKRYHLTEFRTPCLPDEDRQEMPNSILLDFLDGSTLQCACESRQGQTSVLQTLVHAYSAHQPVS